VWPERERSREHERKKAGRRHVGISPHVRRRFSSGEGFERDRIIHDGENSRSRKPFLDVECPAGDLDRVSRPHGCRVLAENAPHGPRDLRNAFDSAIREVTARSRGDREPKQIIEP
jgi:hypothetical protein